MSMKTYCFDAAWYGKPSNEAEVLRRLKDGNAYRNKLVEIEHTRRERSDEILRKYDPKLQEMEKELEELDQRIAEEKERIKTDNQQTRKRTTHRSPLKSWRGQRKQLNNSIKARKKKLRDITYSPKVQRLRDECSRLGPNSKAMQQKKAELQAAKLQDASGYAAELLKLDEWAKNESKKYEEENPLYVYHKTAIQKAVEQACKTWPQFRSWKRPGGLWIQIRNMTSQKLFRPNSWLYLEPVEHGVAQHPPARGARIRHTHIAHIRINSVGNGREYTMVSLPIIMHRSIPPCDIVGARLYRNKIATQDKWQIQIQCKGVFDDDATMFNNKVWVDLGWRQIGTRKERMPWDPRKVAHWRGSDSKHGILVIPEKQMRRYTKCESLQSIRDEEFNKIRDKLKEWLKTHDVPDWLTEATKTLAAWRSQARLAGLILKWRSRRFDGDVEIFRILDGPQHRVPRLVKGELRQTWSGWRNWDKHLYEMQANLLRGALAWRKDFYRKFAAQLSRKYGTVVLENVDWRQTMRRAPTEKEANDHIRLGQRFAAPGQLADCLKKRFAAYEIVEAAGTTSQCHKCHKWVNVGAASKIQCPHCNAVWDRDDNACINMSHKPTLRRQVRKQTLREKAA